MNTQKSTIPYGLICAALCTLNALHLLVGLFSYFRFLNLLSLACYIYIAVMLFTGKRGIVSIAGFGGLSLVFLLRLLKSSGFFGVLLNLTELAAFASLTLIAVVSMTDYLPQLKETVKKLWFVPGAAAVLSFLHFHACFPLCCTYPVLEPAGNCHYPNRISVGCGRNPHDHIFRQHCRQQNLHRFGTFSGPRIQQLR